LGKREQAMEIMAVALDTRTPRHRQSLHNSFAGAKFFQISEGSRSAAKRKDDEQVKGARATPGFIGRETKRLGDEKCVGMFVGSFLWLDR
jgi:hypothetical protein